MGFLNSIFKMNNIYALIALVSAAIISITLHEIAHGYAAYFLGDKTAKIYGRLTLNPLKHIDWFGALCLVIFHFGWAKPVPINMANIKNRKLGLILVSLAGPLTNFILALIFVFVYYLLIVTDVMKIFVVSEFVLYMIYLNIGLGIFNLIPVPPLDGSKVLASFLPQKAFYKYLSFERYGSLVLLICFAVPFISNIVSAGLRYLRLGVLNGFEMFVRMILGV
ncbi:MAG: site-2 protease family protein [Clostridia bacterium]|nr:site-2 protease family protein [Clostridia bacterium]